MISTLALALAVGGGAAYAANTIRSEDIVNGEVKRADIGGNAVATDELDSFAVGSGELAAKGVTSSKLGDGSVGARAVANGSLSAADHAAGPSRSVVARIRSTAEVQATGASAVPIPLTGNNWTQAADEVEDFIGELRYSTQACGSSPPQNATVHAYLDDQVNPLFSTFISPPAGGTDSTRPFPTQFGRPTVFAPGAADARTLRVEVQGTQCEGQGVTIKHVKINVLGFR